MTLIASARLAINPQRPYRTNMKAKTRPKPMSRGHSLLDCVASQVGAHGALLDHFQWNWESACSR